MSRELQTVAALAVAIGMLAMLDKVWRAYKYGPTAPTNPSCPPGYTPVRQADGSVTCHEATVEVIVPGSMTDTGAY